MAKTLKKNNYLTLIKKIKKVEKEILNLKKEKGKVLKKRNISTISQKSEKNKRKNIIKVYLNDKECKILGEMIKSRKNCSLPFKKSIVIKEAIKFLYDYEFHNTIKK